MRVIVVLASLSLLIARTAIGQRVPSGESAKQIATIEHRIERALVETDTAFLESVYAPAFRFKHAAGNIDDRATWLAGVRGSRGKYLSREVDSVDVEVHDDVALATGRIHVRSHAPDGSMDEYTLRYIRVYALRAGRWLLLTHHSSQLTKGPLTSP
jgi:ketosteroid isomerase-like protein